MLYTVLDKLNQQEAILPTEGQQEQIASILQETEMPYKQLLTGTEGPQERGHG